jgi:hypothetical protein
MLGHGGVQRLTDAEILTRQAVYVRHIHKTAHKSTKELVSIDIGKLDDTGRKSFNLRMSHAVLLENATTAHAVKRIGEAVDASKDKLPPAKTGLALFQNGHNET